MAPAAPGNAPNVSSASSPRFGEKCRQGGETTLCWARGTQRHTKTLCWLSLPTSLPF